jgi:hypothetical protein
LSWVRTDDHGGRRGDRDEALHQLPTRQSLHAADVLRLVVD